MNQKVRRSERTNLALISHPVILLFDSDYLKAGFRQCLLNFVFLGIDDPRTDELAARR